MELARAQHVDSKWPQGAFRTCVVWVHVVSSYWSHVAMAVHPDDLANKKMAELGAFCLALGEEVTIKNIWELGPATFNREGDWTSSQHCSQLGYVINKEQGFAQYRYGEVWAHHPNPFDPIEVAKHGNTMSLIDSKLPTYPLKPLCGMFRKTHMVTLLQQSDKRMMTYPDSDEVIDINSGITWVISQGDH